MTASDQDVFAYDDSRDQVAAQDGRMPLMLGYAAYTQQLRYGSMLKSIWAGDKLYNPSYALATDPDAYEVCMRYSVFRQCVDARLRKVSMRQWSIQPGDEFVLRVPPEACRRALADGPASALSVRASHRCPGSASPSAGRPCWARPAPRRARAD